MKLSELLVLYAIETAQTKVSNKTAEQFLNHIGVANDYTNPINFNPEIYRQTVKQIKNDSK